MEWEAKEDKRHPICWSLPSLPSLDLAASPAQIPVIKLGPSAEKGRWRLVSHPNGKKGWRPPQRLNYAYVL